MIATEYLLTLDGREVEVEVLGTCRRVGSKVECEVEKVMLDGRDRYADVPQDHMRYMAQRLWHASISQRHPGGDTVEDVGA